MQKYPEYKTLNLPSLEKEILDFWKRENIFSKSISLRQNAPPFVFYEGPPSANGRPGIHHVLSRTIKDLFCRFKTLEGFKVERKGGWDTHGLPVELGVEKMLDIRKEDIGTKISVAEYNSICRKEVMKYKDVWDKLTEEMGYWVDLENPYITFETGYMESVWWLLKKFYEKKFLYQGYTIQPYSPAAGTGLSSHELNQPGTYRNIRDVSITAQFRLLRNVRSEFLVQNISGDVFFLAWTTTPWTLPGNCALAVGENIQYSAVRTFNAYTHLPVTVILATDRIPIYFPVENSTLELKEYQPGAKQIPYHILQQWKGKELLGVQYEQLLPYVQPAGKAFEVIAGDFVTTDDGTGIVHTASLFGADDFRVCKQNGIASIEVKDENGNLSPIVDLRGRFVKEITDFANEFVKEQYLTPEEKETERKKQGGEKYLSVDERIAIKLKKENKAYRVEKFEHSYPHCWRTDKPILYYPLNSWFIQTTAAKEKLIELNQSIHWKPEWTGTGRFGEWLENLQDWNLSRSRFWGTPLPIWRTADGSEEKCIGSVEELRAEFEKAKQAGLNASISFPADLHRPFVDELELLSPSGKPMRRIPDLIDVWFDSGAMPYAQWHYPFENHEEFEKNFPADFIAEGVDQTRGWFFTLHVIAGMLFNSVAYKTVLANGLVLDKEGNKMSKRLGNVVDPFECFEKFGADATRWYLMSNGQPWENMKFDLKGVDEIRKSFFGTLFNTYGFYALYANIDGFVLDENDIVPVRQRSEMDRWIISKLHSTSREVAENYRQYDPAKAARLLQEFTDEHLSNWYVRLSRRKFWKSEMGQEKKAAYETLHECLLIVSQLMSPVAPFFSEWLYKNLTDGIRSRAIAANTPLQFESIHHTVLMKPHADVVDEKLEHRMQLAQDITSLALSLRKKVNIKVRQPLQKLILPVMDHSFRNEVEQVKHIILSELNVKEIEYIIETEGVIHRKVKPDFKKLGARLGRHMKEAGSRLSAFSQKQIAEFERSGIYRFSAGEEEISISIDEVEMISEDIPGFTAASKNGLTVALDIQLSETLVDEGNARELVSAIQKYRREAGFQVTDHIKVYMQKQSAVQSSVIHFKKYISAEILADEFELVDQVPNGIHITVNDISITLSIQLNSQV